MMGVMRTPLVLGLALVAACSSGSSESEDSEAADDLPLTTAMPTSAGDSGTTVGMPDATTSMGTGSSSSAADTTAGSDGNVFDVGNVPDAPPPRPLPEPQLWYTIDDLIVYIELDPADGTVAQLVTSTISNVPPLIYDVGGTITFNAITMLDDGSLLGARGLSGQTQLYHLPAPPTMASDVAVDVLGDMDDGLFIEGLYTDCDGRVYLMDTGVHSSTAEGNRLLRFTGDFLGGDFSYEVITDLMVAVAPDIDDMAPGIDAMGAVVDNPGFAIDSGTVYEFDYTTGTGNVLGAVGTYGIHALGGVLFDDGVSRLYVLTLDAELLEVDPVTLAPSPVLVVGPAPPGGGPPGLTGITGPLTDCVTGFPRG